MTLVLTHILAAMIGSAFGVLVMCLVQINRGVDDDQE